jgi:drug/metabolite transporter (DMT)-like permease
MMRTSHVVGLVVLAAIWGGSFIFMRVLAPVLGPFATTDARVLIAGVALLAYMRLRGLPLHFVRYAKAYLVVGLFNSAVPFVLFAYSALHIPAAYSAVANSTSPLFGALFSALWLAEPLTSRKIAGLVAGMSGVALIGEAGGAQAEPSVLALSLGACLLAAISYSLTGIYIKKFVRGPTSMGIATGSLLMAGLVLLPVAAFFPPPGEVTPLIAGNLLALALLCSGVAYLIYYWLMADLGPTKALTVTFLIPPFGILWGVIFLGEALTWAMAAGCTLVVFGTLLVVRDRPKPLPKFPSAASDRYT